jgi:hypothetical protein
MRYTGASHLNGLSFALIDKHSVDIMSPPVGQHHYRAHPSTTFNQNRWGWSKLDGCGRGRGTRGTRGTMDTMGTRVS